MNVKEIRERVTALIPADTVLVPEQVEYLCAQVAEGALKIVKIDLGLEEREFLVEVEAIWPS